MTQTPLMPMATAVWLVENTTLTFKQIADFCNLHEVEVQGIADGEVAKGIKAYNPITSGQLTKEEIELSSKDQDRALKITNTDELGIYNVYKNKELFTSFATELHPNEIVSKQISADEIEILLNGLEYKFITASHDLINVFKEIRHGKALWKIFLIHS